MIIATTDRIDGKRVRKVLGVVHTSSMRGTTWTKDVLSRVADVFGGKTRSYEKDIDAMVDDAMKKLIDIAARAGANGVLGVNVSLATIPTRNFGFFLCTVSGTAVILEEQIGGE